jgi:hypothetical protein
MNIPAWVVALVAIFAVGKVFWEIVRSRETERK